MSQQYAPVIEQFRDTAWSVSTIAGSITAGPISLFAQSINRAGRNLLSTRILTNVNGTQGLRVEINSNVLAGDGEDLFAVEISRSLTGNAADAKTIARIECREADQQTYVSFPVTIDLTTDDDLAVEATISEFANLPSTLENGALRRSVADSIIYRYNQRSNSWAAAYPPTFDAFQTSTTALYGSDRNLSQVEQLFYPPLAYDASGAGSEPIRIAYFDARDGSGATLPIGFAFNFRLFLDGSPTFSNGQSVSEYFAGKVFFTLVDQIAYSDLSLQGIGEAGTEFIWSPLNNPLFLSSAVSSGDGVLYEFRLQFGSNEVAIADGAQIDFDFTPAGVASFEALEGYLTGAVILPAQDRLRVVPGFIGAGVSIGGTRDVSFFSHRLAPEKPIPTVALQVDTAEQGVYLNTATGASARILQIGATPASYEILRARISTEAGIGVAVASSPVSTLATGSIEVTITHPYDVVRQRGIVRADYPDTLIAGAFGAFDPPHVHLYIESGGTVTDLGSFGTVIGASQLIVINAIAGNVIGAVPTPSDAFFGPYQPTMVAGVESTGGTIPAGTYTISVAYEYDSPNLFATKINNSASGVPPELATDLATALAGVANWLPPIADVAAARAYDVGQIAGAGTAALVLSLNRLFRYDPTETGADDDVTILSLAGGPGAWVAASGFSLSETVVGTSLLKSNTPNSSTLRRLAVKAGNEGSLAITESASGNQVEFEVLAGGGGSSFGFEDNGGNEFSAPTENLITGVGFTLTEFTNPDSSVSLRLDYDTSPNTVTVSGIGPVDNAQFADFEINVLASAVQFIRVTGNDASVVQIYESAAARTAATSPAITATLSGSLTYDVPQADRSVANTEDPIVSTFYGRVENTTGANNKTYDLTFTYFLNPQGVNSLDATSVGGFVVDISGAAENLALGFVDDGGTLEIGVLGEVGNAVKVQGANVVATAIAPGTALEVIDNGGTNELQYRGKRTRSIVTATFSGPTDNVDMNGNSFINATVAGNTTITPTNISTTISQEITLRLTASGGDRTISLPGSNVLPEQNATFPFTLLNGETAVMGLLSIGGGDVFVQSLTTSS